MNIGTLKAFEHIVCCAVLVLVLPLAEQSKVHRYVTVTW
jgi:hypothetical protein